MRALRSKLTYANVISTLCLFLVLGGATAVAANQLARNSVGTKQIRNAAITGPKIKRASIEATKLTQLAISTLDGQRGPKGAKGSTGAKGATGAKGDRGATGAQGLQGVPGGPGAFATIDPSTPPQFVGTHPGFSAVSRPGSALVGVYCLTPTNGTDTSHPVASTDWANSDGGAHFVEPLAGGDVSNCDAGQLEVRTETLQQDPAPIVPGPSNEVAFTVFVAGAVPPIP
jgi:hypothetical protein